MSQQFFTVGKLVAFLLFALLPAVSQAQSTYVKVADEWGTIRPGGPRLATNGNRFWNVQGAADGSPNVSSGSLRFYLADLVARLDADFPGGWQIDNVTLVVEHDEPAFALAGGVSVFHFTKDDVAITNGADASFMGAPADAPPGNFGGLPLSTLVFDDAGVAGGQPVRLLENDFITPTDLGTVTRVNDYMFTKQGSENLDVLGTPGSLVDPAGAINITPHYDLSFPAANADDTLATFETELTTDMGAWIAAGLDTIIADIEDGTDALSFIFAATEANSAVVATYKGNAFGTRFPPRIYIQASGTGGPVGVLGDYNNNGTVDAADYVLWRDGGPLQNEGASPGEINQADYDFWRARFGAVSGSGSGLASVPEPATGCLFVLALASMAFARRCLPK